MKLSINLFSTLMLCLLGLSACTVIPGLHVKEEMDAGIPGAQINWINPDAQVIKLPQKDAVPGAISEILVLTLTNNTLAGINHVAVQPQSLVAPKKLDEEYTLGPGDVVNVIVWDHPELTNPGGSNASGSDINSGRQIDSFGKMFYPYAGELKAAGQTVSGLRSELRAALSRFIKDPQVDIRISTYRSRRVQVSGQVKNPGLVSLDETQKGVLEAINERGGLTEGASQRKIEITRGGVTYTLDGQRTIASRGANVNPTLLHGDVVFVPDRTEDQVFVLGQVKKEGAVLLQSQRTTLLQALAGSEGLDRLSGADSGVLLFRRPQTPGGVATVVKVDLSNSAGLLLAGEVDLQPRDVIYVAATDFSRYNSVIGQLLPTISAVFQTDALVRRIGGR